MSAIAMFELLPRSAIAGLRAAAVPKKAGWFSKHEDGFHDFVKSHATEVAHYNWSAWVMSTLLEYLNEKRGIDLTASREDDLSEFLSKARGSAYFVLTNEHRQAYRDKLVASAFDAGELRDYYNEFTSTDEDDIGRPMLEGITALNQALGHVDEKSIILLSIG